MARGTEEKAAAAEEEGRRQLLLLLLHSKIVFDLNNSNNNRHVQELTLLPLPRLSAHKFTSQVCHFEGDPSQMRARAKGEELLQVLKFLHLLLNKELNNRRSSRESNSRRQSQEGQWQDRERMRQASLRSVASLG
jgi:hypothetical protein